MNNNLQVNTFGFRSNDYIKWLLDILNKQELSMITEHTYNVILSNGSATDKQNLLLVENFARALMEYAEKNYIRTYSYDSNGYDYNSNFNVILKVENYFLSIESLSSTYASFTFVSQIEEYIGQDYIEWELFLKDEAPPKIQALLSNLSEDATIIQKQIQDIIDSEYFNDINLSYEDKKELVLNFITNTYQRHMP